jgi:hypothetical protein
MAVYGPVRHQKNIIWTEASEVHIIFVWCLKILNLKFSNKFSLHKISKFKKILKIQKNFKIFKKIQNVHKIHVLSKAWLKYMI